LATWLSIASYRELFSMELITECNTDWMQLTCSERYSPYQQIIRGQAIVSTTLVKNLKLPWLKPWERKINTSGVKSNFELGDHAYLSFSNKAISGVDILKQWDSLYWTIYLSLSHTLFLFFPLWIIWHPWNALFHFSFLILYTVCRTPWTRDQLVTRPLPIRTQNKHRQTSMPWLGFEPMIPAFERAKTIHALDRAATVIGRTYTGVHHLCTGMSRASETY
jgi:hypothetical protein